MDHPALDLADFPVTVLPAAEQRVAKAVEVGWGGGRAWEAANAWVLEPDYARERLVLLREDEN